MPTQSQDVFCTPDFITPSDVKLPAPGLQADHVSASQLRDFTPLGCKRPRSVFDAFAAAPKKGPSQVPLYTSEMNAYKPPGTKRALRRVRSPPCLDNPFAAGANVGADAAAGLGKAAAVGAAVASNSARQGNTTGTDLVSSSSSRNEGRYRNDFKEDGKVGKGSFSTVYRCTHRLDGCAYAIKQSLRRLDTSVSVSQALQEVQAYGILGSHENILRYHTSWIENARLFIQLELAEGGSVGEQWSQGKAFEEEELVLMLWMILRGLNHLHGMGMAHMDVKPDNIHAVGSAYKLGDLGMACSVRNPTKMLYREGDARYMAPELLEDDISQLDKADIFALGASVYELARRVALPSHGDAYRAIREGKLTMLPNFSVAFQDMAKMMMREKPEERPTAAMLLQNKLFAAMAT